MGKVYLWFTAAPLRISVCQASSRGATPRKQPHQPFDPSKRNLLSQVVCNIGPFALGSIDDAARITEESSPRFFTIEEVKSLPRYGPEQRMATHRSATANGYRIVPAKARRIDFRMLLKSTSISLIAKSPHGAIQIQFKLRQAKQRFALCEVGNGVKSTNGEAGLRTDGQLTVGSRRRAHGWQNTGPQGDAQ